MIKWKFVLFLQIFILCFQIDMKYKKLAVQNFNKLLLEKLYQILKIGGEMAVGNFHISNPSRFYMEYWLDWVLYYRTEHEFMDLLKHVHSAGTKVLFEDTGSQMFLQVKKYEN